MRWYEKLDLPVVAEVQDVPFTRKDCRKVMSDDGRVKIQSGQCAHSQSTLSQRHRDFIERSKSIHGDRYDYSKVDYQGSHTKVVIVCKEHGEFLQRPRNHKGGQGCRKCYLKIAGPTKLSLNEILSQCKKVHGDRYDYSKVEYVNWKTKDIITCPDHGEFQQNILSHKRGLGCPKCGSIASGKKLSKSMDVVLKEFQKHHGDRYDYSKVDYQRAHTKVIIICQEHGEFQQNPTKHRKGAGCQRCARKKGGRKKNSINS